MLKLIDKLVPLPSLFFIGTNGQPIDIVTGVIESSLELIERIKKVADRAQIKLLNLNATNAESNTPGPSAVSSSASTTPPEDVVCDNGVCRKVTKDSKTPEQTPTGTSTSDQKTTDEKVKIAKELLEKKKKEKEDEEAKVVHNFKGTIGMVFIVFLLALKKTGN